MIRLVAWLCTVLACLIPTCAFAGGTAHVRVIVRTLSGGPIANARVALKGGAIPFLALTSASGSADFDDVPAGQFMLDITAAGWESARRPVRIDDRDAHAEYVVTLAATPLQSIGRVTASRPPGMTEKKLEREIGPGRLFGTLPDLINTIGGATVRTSAIGTIDAIALTGQDPGVTGVSFDGTRIDDPVALHAIDPDLLTSASINEQNAVVKLQSLNPTPTLRQTAELSFTAHRGSATRASLQDSIGHLGVVVGMSTRFQDSALSGLTYRDTSGLTYRHVGSVAKASLLAKATYEIGDSFQATIEKLRTTSELHPIPAFFSGAFPAGAGPGNITWSRADTDQISLQATQRRFFARVAYVRSAFGETNDFSTRIAGMTSAPLSMANTSILGVLSANVVDLASPALTVDLALNASSARRTLVTADPSFISNSGMLNVNDHRMRAGVGATMKPSSGTSARLEAEWQQFNGVAALNISGTLKRELARGNGVFAGASSGTYVPQRSVSRGFDDPAEVEYDCRSGVIRARAPNDFPDVASRSTVRVGWRGSRARQSFSVQAYASNYRNVTVGDADVPAKNEPDGFAPPGYLGAVLAGATTYGGCANAPAPGQLYYLHDVSGVSTRYRGLQFDYAGQIARRVTADISLDVHRSRFGDVPSRLRDADSIYFDNGPVPHDPSLHGSMTLDYALGDGRTEALANAALVSANNIHNLPAYVMVSAGVAHRLSRHLDVFLIGSNVGSAYPGVWTSARYAVPLPTASGGLRATLAAPFSGPQATLLFTYHAERPLF